MIPNKILNGIKQLDPLPVTARRLAGMLGSEESNMKEIAKVVEYDPAVAANILRMANSAAYGGRYPVESVRDAVVRLGTANLLTIVLGEYLRIFNISEPIFALTENDLYLHSAASALMINAMVRETRFVLPASASVAALLHDIGKLIMVRYLQADVPAMLALCKEKNIVFVQAEHEMLGYNHAEVGGAVARNWGFPDDITFAIENHHRVIPGGSGPVLDGVMLANYAAKSMGAGLGAEGLNMSVDYAGSRKRLGLSIESFERACAQAAIWLAEQKKDMESAA
jgi:putative nucleotidyltransferase with HDIG domain